MTDSPCPPCGQPPAPVTDPGLTYDPADDTYWFDHAGLRWRFRCRRSGYAADPGVSLEEMARITVAVRNGHVKAEMNLPRCKECGWPLVDDAKDGCTPANCSMREVRK